MIAEMKGHIYHALYQERMKCFILCALTCMRDIKILYTLDIRIATSRN